MKLGLGTYACAWSIGVPGSLPPAPLGPREFLDLTGDLGLRLAQIADNLPLHVLSQRERGELRAQARDLGIRVEVGIRGIQPDNLERYGEIAEFFASPILRAVIDCGDFRPAPREILDILSRAVPFFEDRGITIALENHDRFKARELADLVIQADSPAVGVCLDTVNSLGAFEGPEQVIDILLPLVVNLHLKDARIQRLSHNMGFRVEGTPAGQGMLDIPGIIEGVRRLERPCDAILELWPPPEEDIAGTVEKEQAWVRESVRYLRGLVER